jgi:large subunit ribosomal protein L15
MSMIHDITTGAPRNKLRTRKGRGKSAGKGKTAGRGGKGSSARQGGPHWKPGHEGGQTPIHRRSPKRGFSNENFERRFHVVNLADLERFNDGTTVDAAALVEAGLVPDLKQPVKVLGDGAVSKKLTIVAGAYSRSAYEKIGQAGGVAQNLKGEPFKFRKPKPRFQKTFGPKGGGKKKPAGGEPTTAEGEAPAAAPETPAS